MSALCPTADIQEFGSQQDGATSSAHIFGTLVPVEEPSTASKPDSCIAAIVPAAIAGTDEFSPAVGAD
jgi:hypothetical protein